MDAHAALTSRRPSCAEGVLAALLGAWLLWALLATALTGRTIGDGVEYAALPVVLGAGLVLGRLCARWAGGFVLSAATTALALTVLVTPFYANAQAAVGVQLVALSGLLLSTALAGRPVASRGGKRKRSTTAAVVLPVLTGVLGVLLAARAEAASILVVAVAALVALALALAVPVGVSRVVGVASIGIGLVGVAGALVVVIVLARLPVWPQWLEEDDSLSWARQLLWRDALELWGSIRWSVPAPARSSSTPRSHAPSRTCTPSTPRSCRWGPSSAPSAPCCSWRCWSRGRRSPHRVTARVP